MTTQTTGNPPPNPSLPIIDISPFLPTSRSSSPANAAAARATTASALAAACRDVGFFYLTGHGIPTATLAAILALARRFFLESSDAAKAAIARSDAGTVASETSGNGGGGGGGGDGARGYQRIGENVTKGRRDWHEAVDLYAEWATAAGGAQQQQQQQQTNGAKVSDGAAGPPYELLQGPNLWPAHPPELRDAYLAYIGRVKEVGAAVVRAMGEALGLGDGEGEEDADVFVRATGKSFWVMRLIGYPGLPEGEGQDEGFSCGEHTDYGCVTLLLADDTPNALQVQRKDGSWAVADPIPGAFVVNIGDMMERWTNGLWRSTNHRVLHRGANYRVSVPFFFEPDFDARIRPLRKCVEETGGKEKYEEVRYGEHLLNKVRGNFY